MATSSPLWTVVLAVLFASVGEQPIIVPALNACLLAAAWALCSAILLLSLPTFEKAWKRILMYLAVFALVLVSLGYTSVSQMETALAIDLFLGGVAAFIVDSDWALSLLVLAAFTRLEMAISCLIFLIVASFLHRIRLRGIIGAVAVGLLGTAFLLIQFHTIIPNTIHAKAAGYSVGHLEMAFDLLWDGPGDPQYGLIRFVSWLIAAVSLLWATTSLLQTNRAGLLSSWPVYTAFICGLLICAAYLAHPTLLLFWYRPLYTLPILLFLLFKLCQNPRSKYSVMLPLFVGLWSYHVVMVLPGVFCGRYEASPDFDEVARVHRYTAIGQILNSACPTSTLLTTEIGGLGEGFQGYIVDGLGLSSPEAIKYQPLKIPEERPNGKIGGMPPGIVREKQPDVIVSYDVFALAFLQSPELSLYQQIQIPMFNRADQVKAKDSRLWGESSRLFLFLRRDGRCHPDPALFYVP